MAKKGYSSSYKEKVYYDNTIFRGIMATTDPNQEGYFKQLINFDIDDTGQSLKPRKGLLHTGLHLDDADNTIVTLNPDTTVYYKDHDTEYYIFVDLEEVKRKEDHLISISKYYALKRITNFVSFEDFYNQYLAYINSDTSSTYFVNSWLSDFNLTDRTVILSIMEYFNNLIHGSTVTEVLNDIFNISVSYKSTLELDGKYFITSLITSTDAIKDNSDDNTIYFYDWLQQFNNLDHIEIIGSHYASYVFDSNSIGKNIIKIKVCYDTNKEQTAWIEFKYNNAEDSLVISVVDTDSTYAIDMANRNLASSADIIPNPVAKIYSSISEAHEANVWFNKFPIIYKKKNNNYLLNYTDNLIDFDIQPSYFLLPPKSGHKWAYTYDILSTSDHAVETINTTYNTSGIYFLDTNTNVPYIQYTDIYNKYMTSSFIAVTNNTLESINNCYNSINTVLPGVDNTSDDTYIILIVPTLPSNSTLVDTDTLDYSGFDGQPLQDVLSYLFASTYNSALNTSNPTNNYNNYIQSGLHNSAVIPTYNALKNLLESDEYLRTAKYYIKKRTEIDKYYETYYPYRDTTLTLSEMYNIIQNINMLNNYTTLLNSPLLITKEEPIDSNELLKYIKNNITNQSHFIFKPMFTSCKVTMDANISRSFVNYYYNHIKTTNTTQKQITAVLQMFTNLIDQKNIASNIGHENNIYYIYTSCQTAAYTDQFNDLFYTYNAYNSTRSETEYYYYPKIYKCNKEGATPSSCPMVPYLYESLYLYGPPLNRKTDNISYSIMNSLIYSELNKLHFFDNGLILVIYLFQYPTSIADTDLNNLIEGDDSCEKYKRSKLVNGTSLIQTVNIQLQEGSDVDKTNHIERILVEDPENIHTADNWCIFYSTEGYRLVVWKNNIVYMSEANSYGWFKQDNKKTYPEEVLKVLPYKDKLLVFTTQNMYAIFPYEYVTQVENGKDDEGNTKYVQQTIITYNTLPVLYNLYTDRKYLNVIQIYNSMVLYYSTQGQLYLIAPTATVDSDTMYTLKYVNQAANDILLNYDIYINKRLQVYGIEPITKDDVVINADVSISFIKIFYSIPTKHYTYILLYDIINNRYTVYDTNTFGCVDSIIYTDVEAVIVSKDWNNNLSLCTQYKSVNDVDNNCDLYTLDNYSFEEQEINTEVDTGIIFLNNHLRKRFRSFTTVYKNLNASTLQYTLNVYVDDVRMIHTAMGNNVEIKNVNDLIEPQKIISSAQLLEYNTVLFDFTDFNSNKILSHISTIPSIGKNIEVQMRFKAKGSYKLQSFGLIYKEHSV